MYSERISVVKLTFKPRKIKFNYRIWFYLTIVFYFISLFSFVFFLFKNVSYFATHKSKQEETTATKLSKPQKTFQVKISNSILNVVKRKSNTRIIVTTNYTQITQENSRYFFKFEKKKINKEKWNTIICHVEFQWTHSIGIFTRLILVSW